MSRISVEVYGRFRRSVGQHEFRADLHVTSPVTTVRDTIAFATDTTGPVLKFVSRPNLRLSITEPGDVTAVFDGTRTVTKRRLKPGRFYIRPDGPYSTVRVIARDFAGNDGRPITNP